VPAASEEGGRYFVSAPLGDLVAIQHERVASTDRRAVALDSGGTKQRLREVC